MVLGVICFNTDDCPVREIVIALHCICPILYTAEIICNHMLRTWLVLDVEIEFLQKKHEPGQFPC